MYVKRLNLDVNNKIGVFYWSKEEVTQSFFTIIKSRVFTHLD